MAAPRVKAKAKPSIPKAPGARVATIHTELARRYVYVRALFLAVMNEPKLQVKDPEAPFYAGCEFYSAVGDILEGKSLKEIEFSLIPRDKVLALLKDGD